MTALDRNPYSANRHADPAIFQGYLESQAGTRLPGGWTLAEIARCLVKSFEGAPSYWIVGDRKLGKTSFLIKLQSLLTTPSVQRPATHRIPFPIYICCREYDSLADFYRGVLERAAAVLETSGTSPKLADLELFSQDGFPLPDFELVDLLRQDLFSLFAERVPSRFRVVLLIDHLEDALERGWAAPLFAHLRALLTDASRDAGIGRETLSVAIAGCRSAVEPWDAAGLLDLLEEIPLRTLAENEVWTLVSHPSPIQLELAWSRRIHEATAGHPWLVQFIMETFVRSFQVQDDLDENFESMVTTRFQRDPERVAILREWLDSLSPEGIKVLAHLALDHPPSSIAELSAATGLSERSVEKHLQHMIDLGIVFKPRFQKSERYVLGSMFRHWFLAHTGGQVFLNEIESLRKRVAAREERKQSSGQPFSLLVTLGPDVIVADGRWAQVSRVDDNRLSKRLDALVDRAQTAQTPRDLFYLADDLVDAIRQSEWREVWNDYSAHIDPRTFVLQLADARLLGFPVEILRLRDGENFLGLEAPVYKEMTGGIRRALSYRWNCSPFAAGDPLNVLLVGSNFGDLPLVDQELIDICKILQTGGEGALQIGKIVALTDMREALPGNVRTLSATATNFRRALRGELEEEFHLLHYSGHFISKEQGRSAGFLFGHEGRTELFNLTMLENALERTKLRLAFLSSCKSGAHESDQLAYHLGAAHTALRRGVPAVIGMRWPITDDDALLISQAFYLSLAGGRSPEDALWKARREVKANLGDDSILWAAPVMLTC